MSTPVKRGLGVRAPFKSPLRPNSANLAQRSTSPTRDVTKATSDSNSASLSCPPALEEEIENLTTKLMIGRTKPLDIDKDLEMWRNRMHAYNEAKDACLQIFGWLAHAKGCLVRDLYAQYGLELDD